MFASTRFAWGDLRPPSEDKGHPGRLTAVADRQSTRHNPWTMGPKPVPSPRIPRTREEELQLRAGHEEHQ